MNKLLFLFFSLFSVSMVSADTLDIIFRYYDASGLVQSTPLSIEVEDGAAEQLSQPDAAGWQHWRLMSADRLFQLDLATANDSIDLSIDVLSKYRNTVRSIVINRLQVRGKTQILKVNELTCKWTGSIAYPIEYSFNNPLDGNNLHLETLRCERTLDSLSITLYFLSDSVMLYKCGKNEALFFKYYLQSNGHFARTPSNYTCTEFTNEEERRFYEILTRLNSTIQYEFQGKKLILKDSFCYCEFEFE